MQNDQVRGEVRKTPALLIALAWAFVGIPLAAGVFQTLLNAAQLFR